MLIRRLLPLACILALGCDPDSEPVGEGPESDSGSDSMTTMGSSTSGDSTTGMPTTAGSASASGSSTSGSDSMTSVGSSGFPDDTGGPLLDVGDGETTGSPSECDLEALVCEMVENGKVLPEDVVDCGSVTLENSAEDYAAMRDCILDASESQLAYKGFAQLQGIDSEVWIAYGSLVGVVYGEHQWTYDNYQGAETIWMSTCPPVPTENPGCEPGPQIGLCLQCNGEKPPTVCSSE